MFDLVATLQKNGYKVWRYKIENVIIDSKIDDSRLHLVTNLTSLKSK